MSLFPSYQTPVKAFDLPQFESASRTFGHDSASPMSYQGEGYGYDTPARYQGPVFSDIGMGTYPTPPVYQAPAEPCNCIHCDAARKEIQAKYQQQTVVPYVVPETAPPQPVTLPDLALPDPQVSAEETTPQKKTKPSKMALRSGGSGKKSKAVPVQFSVTVQCRHKQGEYLSKFPVEAQEYVFVEGDRGEDVGRVLSCEQIDPANAPKTTGSVLRAAKTSEVDSFHSLSDEELSCVRTCQSMVENLHLPLIVHRAAFQYDRKKLTFFYEANDRVDFRALLHDLYQEYRCRIWMERLE